MQKNNESHVSGISPFFSSEDINVSITAPSYNESVSEKLQTPRNYNKYNEKIMLLIVVKIV